MKAMSKQQLNQLDLITAIKIVNAAGQKSIITMNTSNSQIKAVARSIVKSAKKANVPFNY